MFNTLEFVILNLNKPIGKGGIHMKISGQLVNSYQVKLDIDGFEYLSDQSEEKGGTNTGTTPHGFLLSSIASCKIMVAKGYLDHNNLPYERVEMTGNSKILGIKRNESIEINIHLKVFGAHLDEKELGYMTRIVDKGCTMANILTAGEKNKVSTTIINGEKDMAQKANNPLD